jgi:hypothetical protein
MAVKKSHSAAAFRGAGPYLEVLERHLEVVQLGRQGQVSGTHASAANVGPALREVLVQGGQRCHLYAACTVPGLGCEPPTREEWRGHMAQLVAGCRCGPRLCSTACIFTSYFNEATADYWGGARLLLYA